MKKFLPYILGLVFGVVTFFVGMQVGKGSQPNLANMTPEQRQQLFQGQARNGAGVRTGGNGNNFINGEIIAKDDKSITVKGRDGGSKIIFLGTDTEVSKFAAGALSDLAVGQNISCNGKANPDGSVTAQMIQIRPNTPAGQNPPLSAPQTTPAK